MINLNSKIVIKLLGYYFINIKASHYINELARLLKVDPGNLFKKLNELEREGLFSSEFRGKQKYYFLNPKYPLFSEVKKMFNANFGLEERLTKSLKQIKGLKSAMIFGSYAKGHFGKDSDIDLLVIGDHSSIEVQRIISELQSQIKREINVVDFTEKEYKKRLKIKDEFINHIFKNKFIKLI
jgi:predicted nucleotidyltransferase